MSVIERKDLRVGFVISYSYGGGSQVLHGTIVHLGLGLASRNAVWVRCSDGHNQGSIECVMLVDILGITVYVDR